MKNKKITSTPCGDWHLGWGYGGHNKVGKLKIDEQGIFTWSGHSQGRHGQKWNAGAKLVFTSDGQTIDIISQKGEYPKITELMGAVKVLQQDK